MRSSFHFLRTTVLGFHPQHLSPALSPPGSPGLGCQLLSHSSLRGSQMSLANQGVIGNLGGQPGPVRSPQVQHSTFQSLSAGTTCCLSAALTVRVTEVSVRVCSPSGACVSVNEYTCFGQRLYTQVHSCVFILETSESDSNKSIDTYKMLKDLCKCKY